MSEQGARPAKRVDATRSEPAGRALEEPVVQASGVTGPDRREAPGEVRAGDDDPLLPAAEEERPRRRFELDDRGFDEVPVKYRRFYRRWEGPDDSLAPNEVLCPVCKVVVRSTRELRPGDRIYCMACMTRMRVVLVDGRLEGQVEY